MTYLYICLVQKPNLGNLSGDYINTHNKKSCWNLSPSIKREKKKVLNYVLIFNNN